MKEVAILLKDDHRLMRDVDFWGEILPEATMKAYGREMNFAEVSSALGISPWEQDYLSNQFKKVSDFAKFVLG